MPGVSGLKEIRVLFILLRCESAVVGWGADSMKSLGTHTKDLVSDVGSLPFGEDLS